MLFKWFSDSEVKAKIGLYHILSSAKDSGTIRAWKTEIENSDDNNYQE